MLADCAQYPKATNLFNNDTFLSSFIHSYTHYETEIEIWFSLLKLRNMIFYLRICYSVNFVTEMLGSSIFMHRGSWLHMRKNSLMFTLKKMRNFSHISSIILYLSSLYKHFKIFTYTYFIHAYEMNRHKILTF